MWRFLLSLILLNPSTVFSQKQGNIWYFGDGYGLDFNTVLPTLLDDGQTAPGLACGDLHIEGTASIADSSGSLLFYTDGRTLWNKEHEIMDNGTDLLGGISSTQAALIVPKPLSDTRYYVFTTDDFCNDLANGLRYSVVDVCQNGKEGSMVLDGFKNVLLLDTVAEKLSAVRHNNGDDYWIIAHKYFSANFYAFPLTAQGVGIPVISSVGSMSQGGGSNSMSRAIGQMKFSPDGSRLAIGAVNDADICEVFDFNTSTGIVSNPIVINTLTGAYGVAFSPDGTKLYQTPLLTQFDLNAGGGNPASINASAYQYSDPNLECGNALQLGPDGKIYMYNCFDNDISVINNPNLSGAASNAVANVYTMQTSALVYGLPAMIAGYDYTATGICDTATGIGEVGPEENILLETYPNPLTTYTEITYQTPRGTQPMLQLTDMLGRVVQTVQLPSNEGTYTLQAAQLGTGIYFCSLLSGTEVLATQKISVMKHE